MSPPLSSSAAESNGSFVRPQPDPPSSPSSSMLSTLASIGGEPLEGSGFAGQSVHRGFAGTSVAAAGETLAPGAGPLPPAAVANATTGAGETSAGSASTGNTGSASEIASVRAADSTNPPLLPRTIRGNPLTRAVDQVRGLRRRLRSLPSDAAPHATPPRMPIEHEE